MSLSYVDTVQGIGMSYTYEGLKPIIDRFAPYAYRIFFPFPKPLVQGAQSSERNILFIFFTPVGLKRAIAANADPVPAL